MRDVLVAAAVALGVVVLYVAVSTPSASHFSIRTVDDEPEEEWNPDDYVGTAVESFHPGSRPYEVRCQDASMLMVKVALGETRRAAIKFAFGLWFDDELATMWCTARILRSVPGECVVGAWNNVVHVTLARSPADTNPHYGILADSIQLLGPYETAMDRVVELYPHLGHRRAELQLGGGSVGVRWCDPEATRVETETVRRLNAAFTQRQIDAWLVPCESLV